MAGSAFYGYRIEKNASGKAVVVRNKGPHMTGNYYKTKTAAMRAATKHNKLMRRANPAKASKAGKSYAEYDALNQISNIADAWSRYKATQAKTQTEADKRAFTKAYQAGQKRYKRNPAGVPRGKWVKGSVKITKSGKVQFKRA